MNFDSSLRAFFGEKVSLQRELSVALQFAKLDVDQIAEMQKHDILPEMEALDARLVDGLSEDDLADLEYQFKVVYTFSNSSKGNAHIQFIQPDSEQAKEVKNVLLKYKLADEEYPYKPSKVVELVSARSGLKFTTNNHVQAWKYFKARPKSNSKQPAATNKEYCLYHPVHRDYTYSIKWVDLLVAAAGDAGELAKIKALKV